MRIKSLLKPSLDWLLIFVPAALVLRFWLHNETVLFICSGLAIVPLAGWMGRATEELAEHLGEGAGGLLNATFGNAAELIIGLLALSKGLVAVVKASITGSIIGNLLLVLGLSMAAGGMKYSEQRFNRTAARSSAASLTLAAIALLTPTVFHYVADKHPSGWSPAVEQKLSLAIGVVLFLTYIGTLIFSLVTHRQLFAGKSGHHSEGEAEKGTAPRPGRGWSRKRSMVVLVIATALVAWMSELLVSTVEHARTQLGLSEIFVGVIVVAVIGNAAEHSTAVVTALKNKMDLSLGIAIGSSLQIALFVAPLLLFLSFPLGHPITLEFTIPEVVAVIAAVHIMGQISGDGESNWMEGVQLLSVYVILAILFYFLPA